MSRFVFRNIALGLSAAALPLTGGLLAPAALAQPAAEAAGVEAQAQAFIDAYNAGRGARRNWGGENLAPDGRLNSQLDRLDSMARRTGTLTMIGARHGDNAIVIDVRTRRGMNGTVRLVMDRGRADRIASIVSAGI